MTHTNPSDDRPDADGAPPDEVARALRLLFDVSAATPEFQAELGARLGREFAALYSDSDQGNGTERNGNGTLPTSAVPAPVTPPSIDPSIPHVLPFAAVPQPGADALVSSTTDATEANPASIPARRMFSWTALCKWGAVAACLVAAFLWWAGGSRYSWATMVAALERNEWVQIITHLDSGVTSEGWFSRAHGVTAVKKPGQVEFDDRQAGVRLVCIENNKVVGREPLTGTAPPSTEAQLVWLMLNSQPADNGGRPVAQPQGPNLTVAVVNQSWQRAPNGNIELQVRVVVNNVTDNELQLRFDLDPQTQLPKAAAMAGQSAGQGTVQFAYPSSGPRNINVLGVSQEFPVIPAPEVSSFVANAAEAQRRRAEAEMTAAARIPAPMPAITPAVPTPVPDNTAPTAILTPPAPREPLPAARSIDEMRQRVDEILRGLWNEQGVVPVARASDEEFLRRAYLDFLGRIPSVSEVRAFLADTRPERRDALLDNLVSLYDHASHLAAVWRTFLIPSTADLTDLGGTGPFEAWLTERFRENQPYDKLVTDLLLAEGRAKDSGPLLFYTALKLKPEEIARQTSRAFLGMRLDCAQCHDHFFDDRWKQRDFWGYAAFFSRISQPEGKLDRVSPVLRIRDTTRGEAMLPGTSEVVAPRYPLEDAPVIAAEAASRRQLLATWLTSPDNPHFARATVNRVWFSLFGRGLVNPVDDMRTANEPVSSVLLAELSEYFIRSGYDVRRLYLTLARTEAYQLSSSSADDNPARQLVFAQMNTKCFSAEQLYDCIVVATRVDAVRGAAGLNRANNSVRQQFIASFRVSADEPTEYQAGITQALALMNGTLTHGSTQLPTSGLLRSLQAPFFSDEQRVETLFLATVSRVPTERERDLIVKYLQDAKSPDERTAVLGDTLWALLNSAEFTVIH